jgi:xylulokinase
MSEPLFLGLDLSTQQLKALIINKEAVVVYDLAVGYDRDLPQYGTTNGATHGPGNGEVTSPVAMWIEALDLILQRMKDAGVDFSRICAISGAGQVLLIYAPVKEME